MILLLGAPEERREAAYQAVTAAVNDMFYTQKFSMEEIAAALAHKLLELKKEQ